MVKQPRRVNSGESSLLFLEGQSGVFARTWRGRHSRAPRQELFLQQRSLPSSLLSSGVREVHSTKAWGHVVQPLSPSIIFLLTLPLASLNQKPESKESMLMQPMEVNFLEPRTIQKGTESGSGGANRNNKQEQSPASLGSALTQMELYLPLLLLHQNQLQADSPQGRGTKQPIKMEEIPIHGDQPQKKVGRRNSM